MNKDTLTIGVLDVETTIQSKGNPNHQENTLQIVGISIYKFNSSLAFDASGRRPSGQTYESLHAKLGQDIPTRVHTTFAVEHGGNPYNEVLKSISFLLKQCDMVAGFNLKFDLKWIRKYIPDYEPKQIFDCQLAEFILKDQTNPYPSLEDACASRGLGTKIDVVKLEYWEKGINTDQIPFDVLDKYCTQDCDLTWALFKAQLKELPKSKHTLLELSNEDLLALMEIEEEGLIIDESEIEKETERLQGELLNIDTELGTIVGVSDINWNSNDQVSAVLFGGLVHKRVRIPTQRTLVSGEIKHSDKWGYEIVTFQGIYVPNKFTKLSPSRSRLPTSIFSSLREPYTTYPCDEDVLQRLININKTSKKGSTSSVPELPSLLLRRREISKLLSTYFIGIKDNAGNNGWPLGKLFPTYNQVVVVSGRLSGSNPNPQNIPEAYRKMIKPNEPN